MAQERKADERQTKEIVIEYLMSQRGPCIHVPAETYTHIISVVIFKPHTSSHVEGRDVLEKLGTQTKAHAATPKLF